MELQDCQVVDVSDACDELGVPAVRTGELAPVWPGCPPLAGRIATITMRPAVSKSEDPMADLLRALADMAGCVVLIDLDGRMDLQCWGGFLTVVAQRVGILGAVVYGAVRDVGSLSASGFPVFASGVYPGRIRGRLRMTGVGAEVLIGDGTVGPAHVVLADQDGVIFLPQADAPRVAELARRRAEQERAQLARLRLAPQVDLLEVFAATEMPGSE